MSGDVSEPAPNDGRRDFNDGAPQSDDPASEPDPKTISTFMDVLSGVLTGSRFGRSVVGPYVPEGESGVGHFVMAIDITATRPLPEFEADMERLIDDLKSTPRRPGVDEIFYPGEMEARSDVRLRESGILLPKDTADELRDKARDLGIPAPF